MHQEFGYPWNAPREAIASPYPTYEEMHSRIQMIAALVRAQELLEKQPTLIQLDVKRRVSDLEKKQGTARANAYLTKTFVERTLPRVETVNAQYRLGEMSHGTFNLLAGNATKQAGAASAGGTLWELMRRFNRLPDMARVDVDLLAGDVANFILAELVQAHAQASYESDYKYTHRVYMTAAAITRELSQTPPLWDKVTSRLFDPEEVTPAIMRMQTEKWWKGRLRRVAASWREHLQIALANVCKKHTPYASSMTVSEWREQKRRTREFLKGMELEDEEGNRISLIEKYACSVANPAIRRCELMTRIRGFENICNEMGFIGEFYTLTAPARYHATIKTGHRNRKWNGASPADTQRYLCSVWQKIRAKLHRDDIRIFGIRVAEPHHDATPHWHMLMFMRPEQAERVREIMRDYAWQEDGSELTTDMEVADSEMFINELEARFQALNESGIAREYFSNVHFQFCPSCLSELHTSAEGGCSLCKSHAPEGSEAPQLLGMKNEISVQLKESKYLLEHNIEKLKKLKIQAPMLKKNVQALVRDYEAVSNVWENAYEIEFKPLPNRLVESKKKLIKRMSHRK